MLLTSVARRARAWALAHPHNPGDQDAIIAAIAAGDEVGALAALQAAYSHGHRGLALGLRAPSLPFLDELLVHVFGASVETLGREASAT